MRESRLLSVLLCPALLSGLLVTSASAANSDNVILDETDANIKVAIPVDPNTDEVFHEKSAHTHSCPVSITKVMTCLFTLETVDRGGPSLKQTIIASSALYTGTGEGASTADIKKGEQICIIDLLYAALILSANEAYSIMAEAVSGNVASFVGLMNTRAAELDMEDTHFSNTHDYYDGGHYTDAYDICLMCREAMKHGTFRTTAGSKSYTIFATNLHPEPHIIRSANALISNSRVAGYTYEYATGTETSSTPEAGYYLAAFAIRENRNLTSVVIGCEHKPGTSGSEGYIYFGEAICLFKWGFTNFSTQTTLDNTKRDVPEVEVTLGKDAASVTLMPDGRSVALLPNDVSAKSFTYGYTLEIRSVETPVEQGQVLGTTTVCFSGRFYGTLNLVVTCSMERDPWLYWLDRVQKFFDNLLMCIFPVVVLVVIAALLLRVIFFRNRGRTGRRGYACSDRGCYTDSRRRRG